MKILQLSIKKKIFLIVFFVILMLLLSAWIHSRAFTQIDTAWHEYREEAVLREKLLAEIYAQFGYGGFIHNFKNYILRGESQYLEKFEQNRVPMFQAIEKLKKLSLKKDAQESEAVGNIENVAMQYVEKIETAKEMIQKNKSPAETDRAVRIDDRPAFAAFSLIQQKFEETEARSIRKLDDARKKIFYLYIGGFAGSGLILLFLFLISRSIRIRIAEISVYIRKIGEGNFASEIGISGNDEIADMARSLRRTVNNLNEMIGKTVSTAGDMSGLTLHLASSIEETSSSLEEMSSMTKRTAENAGQVRQFMKDTDRALSDANDSVKQLVLSMEEITRVADETSVIVKTIDEIAFQTNLLALNAAVEAARAGKMGAGFAVVAGEVRNLALRSAEAAKNTSERITATVSTIQEVSQSVGMTGETFETVKSYAEKVRELVTQISEAADEQALGIEQINKAVLEIDVITQRNASYAENLSEAVRLFKVRK